MGRINDEANTEMCRFGILESKIYDKLFNLTPLYALKLTEDAAKNFSAKQNEEVFKHMGLIPLTMFGTPGIGKTSIIKNAIDRINADIKSADKFGTLTDGTPVPEEIRKQLHYKCKVKRFNPDTEDWESTEDSERLIEFGLQVYTLSGMDRTEFEPIPLMNLKDGTIKWKTPDIVPQEDKHGRYGVVFFDEVTSADVSLMQPYMSASDSRRMIGLSKIPDRWLVLAAGNYGFGNDVGGFTQAAMTRGTIFDTYVSPNDLPYFFTLVDSSTGLPLLHKNVKAFLQLFQGYIAEADTQSADSKLKDELKANPRTWANLSQKFYEWERDINHYNYIQKLNDMTSDYENYSSEITGIIGASVGNKFIMFLKASQNTDQKYDPAKIIEGKERKCEFGALKRKSQEEKGSNKGISGSVGTTTGMENASEVTVTEYQAALSFLLQGLVEKFNIMMSQIDELGKNQGVSWETYFSGVPSALPNPLDDPVYVMYEDIVWKFSNTFAWLINTDLRLEIICKFMAVLKNSMPANYLTYIVSGVFTFVKQVEKDEKADTIIKYKDKFQDFFAQFSATFGDMQIADETIEAMSASIDI